MLILILLSYLPLEKSETLNMKKVLVTSNCNTSGHTRDVILKGGITFFITSLQDKVK